MEEVTLDRLYRASQIVELPGGTKVKVRALSDAERQQSELDSLAAAMRFDKRIKNFDSEEYACYIYPLENGERDTLIEILCIWARGTAQVEAGRQIKDEFITIPDNASLEERMDVEKQREASEAAAKKQREEYIENGVKAAREKYSKLEDDKIRNEAKARRMQYLTASETLAERMCRAVFYGVEKVEGGRFFESYEDVKQLDSTALAFLYGKQQEVDSLDPWAVIKFRAGRELDRLVDAEKEPGKSGGIDSVVVDVHHKPAAPGRKHAGPGKFKSGQRAAAQEHLVG